jgi:DNA-binding transcriptional MerR regulator
LWFQAEPVEENWFASCIDPHAWVSRSFHNRLLSFARPHQAQRCGLLLGSRAISEKEGVVKNLISIGKFSELSELSIRALRLYDELGVLKPAFIDPDTNYRRYGLDQVNTALRIRAMRQIAVPLEKIRDMIGDPDAGRDDLKQHRSKLSGKLEALQSQLNLLERVILT